MATNLKLASSIGELAQIVQFSQDVIVINIDQYDNIELNMELMKMGIHESCIHTLATLLPPVKIINDYFDTGDIIGYGNNYHQYLNTKEPDRIACMIIAILLSRPNTNVIIWNDPNSAELRFGVYLARYLQYQYGITVGYLDEMDPEKRSELFNYLLHYGLITVEKFFEGVPNKPTGGADIRDFNMYIVEQWYENKQFEQQPAPIMKPQPQPINNLFKFKGE